MIQVLQYNTNNSILHLLFVSIQFNGEIIIFDLYYHSSWMDLGVMSIKWYSNTVASRGLIFLQRCRWCLLQPPPTGRESIRGHWLCVHPYFSSSTPYVKIILHECFWAAVLWGVTSRICSKLHVAFLCSSYLTFSLCFSLVSMWCIHTVVMTLLGRNPI